MMWDNPLTAWVGFNVVMAMILAVDLLFLHRESRAIRIREAIGWSIFWVSLALIFNGLVYLIYRENWFGLGLEPQVTLSAHDATLQFFTGYLIEKSLSVDNLFVFLAIFKYFQVPPRHQYRVLFWGIVGAVVLRAVMILTGIALIERFGWLLYVLGAFLVLTGIKLCFEKVEESVDLEHNLVLRMARKFLPIAVTEHEGRFTVRQNGRRVFTSLFLVLLVVESTDVLFAMDSIPAILAITRDPFIAYTSNIFAILGLRAMYFALAGLIDYFAYLRYGLAAVLVFIGFKMLIEDVWHIHTTLSLAVVGTLLGTAVVASVLFHKKPGDPPSPPNNGP